jgi:hypothetical protein
MKSATIIAVLLALGLSACGADVAATAVTVSELQAENAKRAKEQMEQAQKAIADAQKLSQQRLEDIERREAGAEP